MPLPVGPSVPEGLRALLKSFREAIEALEVPGAPTPVFTAPQAELPPAADHPHRIALVSDLNILAHSDGVHWIRQDTGAVIV